MFKHALAPLSGLALLAACQPPVTASPEMASEHVPVVTQQQMNYDLRLAANGTIGPAERQALTEWLASVGARYGDRISLDDPAAAGAEARRGAVAAVLADQGLLLSDVGPVSSPPLPAGSARVTLTRAVATVPGCPDFSDAIYANFENSKSRNYGCATASNLAAMIADPNDLLVGEPHGGIVAEHTVKAIEAYHDRPLGEVITNSAGAGVTGN